jgi:iron complex transport system permease protein
LSEDAGKSRSVVTGVRLGAYVLGLGAATVLVGAACSLVGVTSLSDVNEFIWRLRLLRLGAAATVGAGLAVAGMALQGLLRNPLADPYVLGVSSGAGLGVLVGLALADWRVLPGWLGMPALAFVGAALTCAVVYGIAQRRGRLDPYVLLLSGVIVNTFNGAIMLGFYLFVKPYVVSDFIVWAMGNLTDRVPPNVLPLAAGLVVLGWASVVFRGAHFNALGLGDEVAASSGVAVHRLRVETFLVVSLMTAAAVALAGPVGFMGLIAPHVCRLIVGPDHRLLAVVSGFAGAMFLMVADTFCRTTGEWFGLSDIPVGVVTALCGGPFFIYLLRRRGRESG